jgi:hypothetical protein
MKKMKDMAYQREVSGQTPIPLATSAVSHPQMADVTDEPTYPYGLCISLTEKELAKLDLDDDASVGDTIHIFALAKVTSVSKHQGQQGAASTRIELQITHIALEDEDTETGPDEDD